MDKHLHVNESVVSFQMVIKSKHLVSDEEYMIQILCKRVKRYGAYYSGLNSKNKNILLWDTWSFYHHHNHDFNHRCRHWHFACHIRKLAGCDVKCLFEQY